MENLNNEQTELTAQPASAEEIEGEQVGEVSLGKFKDVSALLSAYGSLQSEFTKRCQKIKELEAALNSSDKASAPTEQIKENITEEDKIKVLKEYLQGVLDRKQKAVLLDGVGLGVKTPVSRPTTIAQAGVLAKEILDK